MYPVFGQCGDNTNTIHYIHILGENIPNSVKVLENLYWGGDFDK